MRKRLNDEGFSIVSVLVALALISIVALSVGRAFLNSNRTRMALSSKLNFEEVNQGVRKVLQNIARNPPASGCYTIADLTSQVAAYPFITVSNQVSNGISSKSQSALNANRNAFAAVAVQRCQAPKLIGNAADANDHTMYFCLRFNKDPNHSAASISGSPHAFAEIKIEMVDAHTNQGTSCNNYRDFSQAAMQVITRCIGQRNQRLKSNTVKGTVTSMWQNRRNEAGITLVELMIGMTLLSLVIVIGSGLMSRMQKSARHDQSRIDTHKQLQSLLQVINRDAAVQVSNGLTVASGGTGLRIKRLARDATDESRTYDVTLQSECRAFPAAAHAILTTVYSPASRSILYNDPNSCLKRLSCQDGMYPVVTIVFNGNTPANYPQVLYPSLLSNPLQGALGFALCAQLVTDQVQVVLESVFVPRIASLWFSRK